MTELIVWVTKCGGLLVGIGALMALLSLVLLLLSMGVLPPGFKANKRFDPLSATRFAFIFLLVGALLLGAANTPCRTGDPRDGPVSPNEQPLAALLDPNNCHPRPDLGKFCHMGAPKDGHESTGTLTAAENALREEGRKWVINHLGQRPDQPQVDAPPVFFKVIRAEAVSYSNSLTQVIAYAEIDSDRVDKMIDKLTRLQAEAQMPSTKAPSHYSQGDVTPIWTEERPAHINN